MIQPKVTPSQYLTVAEVATRLRLSTMTIYRMVKSGQLDVIRTGVNGRTIRVLTTSVETHERAIQHGYPAPHIPGQIEISG